LAEQDGAMIVESEVRVRQVLTMLQPPSDTEGDEETRKGTRQNAASMISVVTGVLAVTISENCPVTLYSKERRAFLTMG
jgi:DNA integrity scanning protein DisA with diadenylate cyclase activity